MTKSSKIEFDSLVGDIKNNEQFLKIKNDLHHGTSKYDHSLRVAKMSYKLGKIFKADLKSLTRSALLHDFFFGTRKDSVDNSFLTHPKTAAMNAKEYFSISAKEIKDIETHMFHLVFLKTLFPFIYHNEKADFKESRPKSKEGWIICLSDLIVSVVECERFQFSYTFNVLLLAIFNTILIQN